MNRIRATAVAATYHSVVIHDENTGTVARRGTKALRQDILPLPAQ